MDANHRQQRLIFHFKSRLNLEIHPFLIQALEKAHDCNEFFVVTLSIRSCRSVHVWLYGVSWGWFCDVPFFIILSIFVWKNATFISSTVSDKTWHCFIELKITWRTAKQKVINIFCHTNDPYIFAYRWNISWRQLWIGNCISLLPWTR